MKKIIIYLSAFPLVALLAFSGCIRAKDLAPNTPACKPVQQTIHGVDGRVLETRIAFEYNAQGKPVRFTERTEGLPEDYSLLAYGPAGLLAKLTAYHSDGQVYYYHAYEYNQAGQLVKMNYHDSNGTVINTDTHEYDSNGNRVRTVKQRHVPAVERTTITYEYAGGNVVKSIYSNGLRGDTVTEYEYYPDRENKPSTYEEIVYGGVRSRNLLKKSTTTRPEPDFIDGVILIYEYTYAYNHQGFPTKVIQHYKSNISSGVLKDETSYEYQCR